ncbi:hypothetical protein L0244_14630 [bacterium]|nr:hypothetical protein [bacterium]
MEKPGFLKEKYTDLNKSSEVDSAARRTKARTGQELPMMAADDRIQNYLNRLKEIYENPDLARRERGIEFVKQKLHEQFVIKPDEIPEAYFESIKRKHREEGHGDIEIPEDYRRELSETIATDQVRSLDNWIDYLSSDDAKYPDWLKYFAIRSMLRMGRYDKKKKSFTERTGGTTAPFPDLNREALAIVLESFERQARGEQPKFGYDIQEDTKKQFIEFLGRKNFAKLYALAVEEFKPIAEELLKVTEGEWRTYPRGSDPKPLVESIAPYGTGWCLRGESMAERYLVRDKNELQVFYSLDNEGKPTVPRVVTVVNSNNQLTEVRGVAPDENLDPYIGSVVEAKLKEFPDGESYRKKFSDMKMLTAIEQKVKQKQELTKDDLILLYEINGTIEGFGYQKDPRVAELRQGRNTEEDMLVIFECTREEIAHVPSQINENTKAYVGQLEPGIFQKLPEHLEHVYTSFPEKKIRRENVEIGGKSAEQLISEMEAAGINISDYAKSMLKNREFVPGKSPEEATLIRLTVADLGFKSSVTTDQIYERAQILGLELCPADTGPNYRLKYRNQPLNESIYMGMKQITGSDGDPSVFRLERYGGGLWLHDLWADPSDEWSPGNKFVFRLRKSES